MKHIITTILLLTANICIAQSDFLRFADWLAQQHYCGTHIREKYRAQQGFTTDMLFTVYYQADSYEHGACDSRITLPCLSPEQLKELKSQLSAVIDGAEQSWSNHAKEDGHLHKMTLAVNGLRNNLLECMSDSGKARSFDLTNHEDLFETLQENVYETSDNKIRSFSIYRKDCTAAQDHTISLNLSAADSLLTQSHFSQITEKTFHYSPNNDSSLIPVLSSDHEKGDTYAVIYEYTSEQDMPSAALETLFYNLLHQRQECEIVHESETIRISSASECMLIAPKCHRILRARATTPGGLYVPHTWWK